MRKNIILIVLILSAASVSFAGGYLNLGADYSYFTNNDLFGSGPSKVMYFNGSAGYIWDFGLITGFRYDHIGVEDQIYNGAGSGSVNARFVGAVPALELGYCYKAMDDKLLWWSTARLGYAVSARYRRDVFDHKATAFVPAISTAAYYQIDGQFYAGIEVGYRYFNVKYTDLGNATLNLSGMFAGVSIIHLFNQQEQVPEN